MQIYDKTVREVEPDVWIKLRAKLILQDGSVKITYSKAMFVTDKESLKQAKNKFLNVLSDLEARDIYFTHLEVISYLTNEDMFDYIY